MVLQVTPSIVNTTTALASGNNPSSYGGSVTFTATVETNGVAAGNATSYYVFKVDGTAVATNALSGGQASYNTSALTAGSHIITAEYAGDASHVPSTNSPALTQTVNEQTPTLTAPTAGAMTYAQVLTNSTLTGEIAVGAKLLASFLQEQVICFG